MNKSNMPYSMNKSNMPYAIYIKYVFMVEYFSMFLYIYIFYFLDNDNFTNISLSYFFSIILYCNYETKKIYQNN